MKRNVCGMDRAVRLVLGLALLAVALGPRRADEPPVTLRRVLAGYGAAELLLINGTLQWCPLNYALGVDTCEQNAADLVDGTVGNGVRAVPVPSSRAVWS